MPIYEYQCSVCHHAFDVLQKMGDDAIQQCPECNNNTAIKLVSAAGFQLKGTGWYETDFKNKPKNKSQDQDKIIDKPSEKASPTEKTSVKTTIKGSAD